MDSVKTEGFFWHVLDNSVGDAPVRPPTRSEVRSDLGATFVGPVQPASAGFIYIAGSL